MAEVRKLAEKTFWDRFKEGFQPASARADSQIEENRQHYGDQLNSDLQESKEERLKKIQKGFLGQ